MKKSAKFLGFTALAIAMFMGTLDSTIINIALPDMMTYFKSNLNDTSWISTIYVLGLSVFMISASKFADQFGRKKMMLIGLVLFGVSSALCSLSKTLLFLIMMRLIQGIAAAMITPIVVPMALELFGKENTQKVAGAVGAVTAIAAAGGPPIGGLLIKYINWQSIFLINVPFTLIAFLLALFFIKESYDKTISKSIDWLGMALLTVALFLLTFSLLKGNDYGWGSAVIISMFIGSVVSAVLFLLVESKAKAPLIELGLFKESTFTASTICYLITGFGIVAPLLIFNFFLQNVLGYEALNAAYIVMAVSLTVIVSMPLGSVIAGKIGARPINFCGVLFMSIGAFLLSRLTMDTSKFIMVFDMIVFGFGLGFSCQSLVSSIKHLPDEKSGIGSGIVNAARQIGTCVGIALLVSILNTNISSAKTSIKGNAVALIQKSNIDANVKATMIKNINDSFSNHDVNDSNTQQVDLKKKMQDVIRKTMNEIFTSPKPTDETLAKLYDGLKSLSDGTAKANDGQKSLNSGIVSLNSGLDKLLTGSEKLTSSLDVLNSGLSQATFGVQTLYSASDQGLGALTSGIGQLNNGTQAILQQFSSSSDLNNPTVYDGIAGVEKGSQSLASNLYSYITAVNNTYYLIIKNNPTSAQLLKNYKNSLEQSQLAYATAVGDAKEQYAQQVQALANLVSLYTAGTDSSVTNEAQFEAKLMTLAEQSRAIQNVVSNGSQIAAGAKQLSSATQQIATQFNNGGTFKNGMQQIANGASKLKQNSKSLSDLQSGIKQLSDSLSQLNDGSNKLLNGSQNLQNRIASAKSGSDNLLSGSKQLVNANSKINDGTMQITSGVSLAGQQNEIEIVMNQIQIEKGDQLSSAFDNVFLLAAIILAVTAVCGLFTDKKEDR